MRCRIIFPCSLELKNPQAAYIFKVTHIYSYKHVLYVLVSNKEFSIFFKATYLEVLGFKMVIVLIS